MGIALVGFGLMAALAMAADVAPPGHAGRFVVRGVSWDDKGCGVCCSAAIKHILTGVRLVRHS